jgi:hypothetical protein
VAGALEEGGPVLRLQVRRSIVPARCPASAGVRIDPLTTPRLVTASRQGIPAVSCDPPLLHLPEFALEHIAAATSRSLSAPHGGSLIRVRSRTNRGHPAPGPTASRRCFAPGTGCGPRMRCPKPREHAVGVTEARHSVAPCSRQLSPVPAQVRHRWSSSRPPQRACRGPVQQPGHEGARSHAA